MFTIFSCKKTSRLLSQSLDHPLKGWERIAMQIHLVLCKSCRKVKTQFHFLQHFQHTGSDAIDTIHPEQTLPEEAKERIRKAIQEEVEKQEEES